MQRSRVTLAICLSTLIGCAPTRFSTAKQELLSKSVMGGSASGHITQTGNDDGASGHVQQPGSGLPGQGSIGQPASGWGEGSVIQGTQNGLPLKFYCTAGEAEGLGTTVSSAKTLELIVKDADGKTVCDITTGVKEAIVSTKALDLSACHLTGTKYTAIVQDPAHPGNLFNAFGYQNDPTSGFLDAYISLSRATPQDPWTASNHVASTQYTLGGSFPWPSAELFNDARNVAVLWASNPRVTNVPDAIAARCDGAASPLVINMTPPGVPDTGLQLSAPSQGVDFDILGENIRPAHTKQRISWIHNPHYMFLALPKDGRVSGVNELFGDNTRGPDGLMAENGFAALAKYDDNHDGVIDRRDEVFAKLRLWSDVNLDGASRPGELIDLKAAGIEVIHLTFDATYYERDEFGNESKFRSTVEGAQTRVIFDLWFSLQKDIL